MQLKSLHFLLTYKCNVECGHCFVFGSPKNRGSIDFNDLIHWIDQASSIQTVKWIYFEGGEPFLYPRLLTEGLRAAREHGLKTGIVTNGFWAKTIGIGVRTLRPISHLIDYLQISCDDLHGHRSHNVAGNALAAASELGIDRGMIKVNPPCPGSSANSGDVLFKGRAAAKLTKHITTFPWDSFVKCDQEDLEAPSRLHIDQYGYAHVCQGLVIGNLKQLSLQQLVEGFDPASHPIISLINRGGPALLAEELDVHHDGNYVDQCQLCYFARKELSEMFPDHLAPELLYKSN